MSDSRYYRNLILPEIGAVGQQRLSKAAVLIVGAGGLGSAVIQYLAAAGIGCIDLIDYDCLELSNLQRQTLYHQADIGQSKIILAKKWLENFNSEIVVETFQTDFEQAIEKLTISKYQVLLDCTDNYPSRIAINKFCLQNKLPYVHAAVEQWQGQLFTWLPGTACYHCIFGDVPKAIKDPGIYGVVGAVAGTIGCLQALEAIKIILGQGELLTNSLLTYNALKMRFHRLDFSHDKNCKICSS